MLTINILWGYNILIMKYILAIRTLIMVQKLFDVKFTNGFILLRYLCSSFQTQP